MRALRIALPAARVRRIVLLAAHALRVSLLTTHALRVSLRATHALCAAVLAMLGFVTGALAQPQTPQASTSHAPAQADTRTQANAPTQASSTCPPTAQPLTPERIQAGMSAGRDRGFLWRITKDGHSSYLYGTIHAAKLEWMFPGPTVADALRRSDTIALELDMLDPGIRQHLAAALVAPRGFALPAALVARLRLWMDAECVAPETLEKMAPELQIASLTVLAARRDGLDPAYSVDLMLAGFGHGAHKRVQSLESVDTQMQALLQPDREAAIAFVESALDDLDAGRTRPALNRVAAIWSAGDFAGLARYGEWCECVDTPAERAALKHLLDDRNPALADAIDSLHASHRNVFAAVGSLHMVGPLGLPALMARRGYTVEPIESAR